VDDVLQMVAAANKTRAENRIERVDKLTRLVEDIVTAPSMLEVVNASSIGGSSTDAAGADAMDEDPPTATAHAQAAHGTATVTATVTATATPTPAPTPQNKDPMVSISPLSDSDMEDEGMEGADGGMEDVDKDMEDVVKDMEDIVKDMEGADEDMKDDTDPPLKDVSFAMGLLYDAAMDKNEGDFPITEKSVTTKNIQTIMKKLTGKRGREKKKTDLFQSLYKELQSALQGLSETNRRCIAKTLNMEPSEMVIESFLKFE
jgi:hypothetical protein